MKKFSQRFLFFVAFSFVLSVISVTAQKNKTSPDDIPSPPPAKVEVKNDPPPAPEPTKSEPSSNSSSSPSYSSSNDTDSPTPTNRTDRTTIRNERRQRTRRNRQRAEIERRRREAAEEARRNRDKDDDRYEDCPTYETYGDCYTYTDDDDSSNGSNPSWASFYGNNDIAYSNYARFTDRFSANYSPYFEQNLRPEFTPLHRIGFFEPIVLLPYNSIYWTFYYEPDLDFLHIDFTKIRALSSLVKKETRFDRLIVNAVDQKTLKRVGKKFKQKGTKRPVIVEDISSFTLDRIYAMNLNRLPKGSYELKLLSKTGDTIKLPFIIK